MPQSILASDIREIADALGDRAGAFAGKTIMLTGGRGFLGRYFTGLFVHLNGEVLADHRRPGGRGDGRPAERPLHVYGTGAQTRTFCYVTDVMNGFLRMIVDGVPGEAYNIGNSKPEVSMLDLVQAMEKVLGRKLDYRLADYPNSYPADEPQRRCPDIAKARRDIGFEPNVTLVEGFRRLLDWTDRAYDGGA